jgi:hypothetical protein
MINIEEPVYDIAVVEDGAARLECSARARPGTALGRRRSCLASSELDVND